MLYDIILENVTGTVAAVMDVLKADLSAREVSRITKEHVKILYVRVRIDDLSASQQGHFINDARKCRDELFFEHVYLVCSFVVLVMLLVYECGFRRGRYAL
jgi:hypothetical protein